ncbi:hypothetical protein GQ53DRAFT_538495 [Thozetella sp. PMI_491]|nr:hypothetical protein GQ53DRAFT_538495 [Thozetella sp. PMI_491]
MLCRVLGRENLLFRRVYWTLARSCELIRSAKGGDAMSSSYLVSSTMGIVPALASADLPRQRAASEQTSKQGECPEMSASFRTAPPVPSPSRTPRQPAPPRWVVSLVRSLGNSDPRRINTTVTLPPSLLARRTAEYLPPTNRPGFYPLVTRPHRYAAPVCLRCAF